LEGGYSTDTALERIKSNYFCGWVVVVVPWSTDLRVSNRRRRVH